MKHNIAILIPYFGKWPEWILLYLHSCAENKEIDFIFITDCSKPDIEAANIHYICLTYDEYCKDVSSKLAIDFSPKSPYKLCDLRPFLGIVHKELLNGYDFWGYGDVDIIWGNIKKFYTDDLLSKYDVFSTHNDRLSGHLTIIRNIPKYTQLCLSIPDWQKKLCSDVHYALDESDFSRLIFPETEYIGKFYRQVVMKIFDWKTAWVMYYSVFSLIHKLLRTDKRRLYFKEQHTTPILNSDGRLYKYESDRWFYKNGSITNDRLENEYIYLHFMIYKKNNIKSVYHWGEGYYNIPTNFKFDAGIELNKNGVFVCKDK